MLARRLEELGIVLPQLSPRGTYSLGRSVGRTLYVSGQGPMTMGSGPMVGVVGVDVTTEQAKAGARNAGEYLLAAAAATVGDIDLVRSVVNLTVYIRGAAGFVDHSVVADGCSELFAEVFGADGLPARAAVGVSTLPFDLSLEATAVFEIAEPGAGR